jgi:hypothetical protein
METNYAKGDCICFRNEPDRWGIVTSLSDDGSTVYYKPRGIGLLYSSTTINKIMLSKTTPQSIKYLGG